MMLCLSSDITANENLYLIHGAKYKDGNLQ